MVKEKKNMVSSEESSSQNIFSRFYNYLEDKYASTSNWLSEKGIPLNNFNNYLEEKGLPAFAIVASILLLLLFIIIFLIFFSFSNQSTLTFSVTDYQGNSLSEVYLKISSKDKDIFKGTIENGFSKKIKLKLGESYTFYSTKAGYPDFTKAITITEKNQNISIVFTEAIEYGVLKIKLIDRENRKTIPSGSAKVNFSVNNKQESKEGIVNIYQNHFITLEVPLNKDLELLLKADGYEDFKETNYRITSKEQEKVIEMDISSLSFEGKSRVTFVVLDTSQKIIDNAEVSIFNLGGEEIANQKTIDGKALAYIDTGETISYRVKKEGYRTAISDENISLRIINSEETFTVVLELGGNFIDISTKSKTNFFSLDDVLITLYNKDNTVIDSGKTDALGQISFKGITSEKPILITACKVDYLCENQTVDLQQTTKAEFILERIDVSNSAILNIFVVDEKNLPVTKAFLKIYELINFNSETEVEVPYNTSLQTDLTGSLALPLRVNKDYRVYAMVGETEVFENIKINPLRENKIIFVVDNASKLIKLDFYDENGMKITSGNLLIRTKDGTVLFDGNISLGEEIIFSTEGYKDLIAEYTDENGNRSVINFSAGQADNGGYLRLDLNKQVNSSDYPVIEFAGVVDSRGIKTNYLTTNKEYYLIFDILFPENTYKGEVHIRAGDDTQTDSEEMSYGITGFSAMDITNFKYGTTYNSEPAPGMQGIDSLNEGSSQIINKWLELKWASDVPLGNKQIKVKVNAVDMSVTKLIFKYRALFEENKLYYRDPIDATLKQNYSNNLKSALYAQTKEVSIDLFNVPLDCSGDICVSYKVIDSRDNEFNLDNFYAVKGENYSLETSIYSLKNSQLNLLAETSKSFPLISFNLFTDTLNRTTTNYDSSNFEAIRDNLSINQNTLKKIYLTFISKEIGTAYIDLKATDAILGSQVFNDRLSFNVFDKKEMKVIFTPDIFVSYGSKFNIEVIDSVSLKPIENAFISFYDDRGAFISSIKGEGSNGRNGNYTIENKFNISTVNVLVESYGYIPYKKQIFIVDNSLLTITPTEVLINLGLDQITSSSRFTLQNNGVYQATNIRFGEPIWVEGTDQIFIDIRGNPFINKNSSQNYEVVVTASNDLKFETAFANVPVYATIGPREITKIIPVRINKGLLVSECIEITPNAVNSFVGLNLKYTAPNVYNTPFTNYNYAQNSQRNNPLLAPSQTYSNYSDYLASQNYTQNYSASGNTVNYTDPNYYTYYSSKVDSTTESTENTTFFIIKNNCSQAITFTPQSVLTSSASNNGLELSLAHVTVLPGEEKVYDVIIKNKSNLKQQRKFTYNILWHNTLYSVAPSTLNVDLLDLSKALWIMPTLIQVPISQLHPQQSAVNGTRFMIKNIGTVPITDIQISQYPKMVSSNIGIKEYPREVSVLQPGASIPIDLQFTVNINKSTADNAFILVSGKAAGINNPITATTQIIFTISSPNCLKVSNKSLDYTLKVGEKRTRNITLTNYCAEPVSVVGIDKKQDAYTETFGANPFRIIPTSGNNLIYPNQSATYALELTANSLGGSPKMPMVIIGRLLSSGNPVTSEDFTVSINIKDVFEDQAKDNVVTINSSLPVCEDLQETTTLSRPLISIGACSEESGYCDAVSSTEYILKKISELQNQIKQMSSQAQAKTMNTGCPAVDAARGYCKISELGGDVEPIEFTFYMQNDLISPELVRSILSKSNYGFKNYFVETNPFNSAGNTSLGVYAGGNKVFVSNQLVGCGKYTIELDGFIAASPDYIYPERAYYFINVLKAEDTVHCEKKIINYLNYLPWDLTLDKNNRQGTWLTLFTGDENISKDLIKGVGKFKTDQVDLRYVYNRDVLSTRNSTLNVSSGIISENKEALAKISFNDNKLYDKANPEQINILLNSQYQTADGLTPDKVKREFVNVVSSMMTKNDYSAKVCVSKDQSYMLILDLVKAGDLAFANKEVSLTLQETASCSLMKIRSSMDETLKISSTEIPGATIGFKKSQDSGVQDTLSLSVLQNQDNDFFMCVTPKTASEMNTLVGQKATVTATSIYSADGKIGNRSATAEVTLASCAITPSEYLLEVYKNILSENNKKDEDKTLPLNITALVDWKKEYNAAEKEEMCSTLQKVMDSGKYNGDFFYNYEQLGCDLKDPEQKTTSRISKGLTNSGQYFLRCSATCAGCYGLSAVLMPVSIAGIGIDCLGFSCGLPALQIFASALTGGEGGLGWLVDKFLGWLFNDPEFKFLGPLFGEVEEWFTGIVGSVMAGAFKTGSSAAATPLTIGEATIDLGSDPFVAQTVTTTTPGVTPNLTRASYTFKGVGKSNLDEFARIITNNSTARYSYVPNYGYGTKAPLFPTNPNRYDELIQKFITSPGQVDATFNMSALNNASSVDLDDLRKLVVDGEMIATHTGVPANQASRARFNTAMTNYIDDVVLFEKGVAAGAAPGTTTTSTVNAIDDASRNNLLDTIGDSKKGLIKETDDSIKVLEKKIADLEKNNARSSFNPKKVKADPNKITAVDRASRKASSDLASLQTKLADAKAQKASLETIKSKVSSLTPDGSGNYLVPDEVIDDFTKLSGSKVPTATSKLKWVRGAGGFVRGLGCGLLGNMVGINGLREKGMTGLNSSIEIKTPIVFEKNIFYITEVDYLAPESEQEYESRYVVDIRPYNSQDPSIIALTDVLRVDKCVATAAAN